MRLIDENNQNLGIVELEKALFLARERHLDLIEVSANAQPPVCKITDFGKYQYQQSKKEKKGKRVDVKAVRLTLNIASHDLEVKAKKAQRFLEEGHKVKVELVLKGREKVFQDLARQKLYDFRNKIYIKTKMDQEPKRKTQGIWMILMRE